MHRKRELYISSVYPFTLRCVHAVASRQTKKNLQAPQQTQNRHLCSMSSPSLGYTGEANPIEDDRQAAVYISATSAATSFFHIPLQQNPNGMSLGYLVALSQVGTPFVAVSMSPQKKTRRIISKIGVREVPDVRQPGPARRISRPCDTPSSPIEPDLDVYAIWTRDDAADERHSHPLNTSYSRSSCLWRVMARLLDEKRSPNVMTMDILVRHILLLNISHGFFPLDPTSSVASSGAKDITSRKHFLICWKL
jgi:hypothetical protein